MASNINTRLHLPLEIVYQIAEDLADQDDILALRMTCKSFNLGFREKHLESIYKCRRIHLVPRSIENIVKIAQHPSGVAVRVQKIILADLDPYSIPAKCVDEFADRKLAEIRDSALSKLAVAASGTKSRLKNKDSWQLSAYLAIRLVEEALTKLPNFRHLHFESATENQAFTRSELNLLYPALGLPPGSRIPRGLALIRGEDLEPAADFRPHDYIGPSARVMSLAPKHAVGLKSLEKISNNHDSCYNVFSIDWLIRTASTEFSPRFHRPLPSLRALDISFSSVGWSALDLNETVACEVALGRFCENLEELRLRSCLFAGVFITRCFPEFMAFDRQSLNLKILHFENIVVNPKGLGRLLEKCKATLEEFQLTDCPAVCVLEPSQAFQVLKLIREHCRRLKTFKLEYIIWGSIEYHPEFKETNFRAGLSVDGLWDLETTTCVIETQKNSGTQREMLPFDTYTASKNIKQELDRHSSNEAFEFWISMADGRLDFMKRE